MDLSAYLLNGVVEATAPPHETAAAARSRGDAIFEMVGAFDPRDAMETMMACHCVMLQFLLNTAMHDAIDTRSPPALMMKACAGAVSISRTLHQWVTKLERVKKRNEAAMVQVSDTVQKSSFSGGGVSTAPACSPADDLAAAPAEQPRVPVAASSHGPVVVAVPAPNGSGAPAATAQSGLPGAVAGGARPDSAAAVSPGAEGNRRRVA